MSEYNNEEYTNKARAFKSFFFIMLFNKEKILHVSHDEQLARSLIFLERIGNLHPALKNWYRGGNSPQEGLRFNVVENPEYLREEASTWHDKDEHANPQRTKYVLWNGQIDPFKGGLSISYDGHGASINKSSIKFKDPGYLLLSFPGAREILIGIMRAAVEVWPEIDWGVIAPWNHYLKHRVFMDRQTIGWIGYCPHTLTKEIIPEAEKLIPVPERGTIVVSCPDVMDEKNKAHYERVGDIDTKLVELGYLPMFNT
ncbi:Imm52 family immunity protein [Metapseudomonas otitidis]|uniref:Imm52 family immunity protein n=1 Tax=Metapseudomonas otitidis TaxID=319939 RepID=UPI0013F618BD|nr:Imm52 family immunity protein [Pseudomonas otitidis]